MTFSRALACVQIFWQTLKQSTNLLAGIRWEKRSRTTRLLPRSRVRGGCMQQRRPPYRQQSQDTLRSLRIDEFRYLERSDRETVMRPEDLRMPLNVRKAIGTCRMPSWAVHRVRRGKSAARRMHGRNQNCRSVLAISDSGKYSSIGMEATDEIIRMSGQIPHTS